MKNYGSKYHYLFNFMIVLISACLSYLTLFICKSDQTNSPMIPVFFSAIYILIMACIFVYSKFINLMKENTLSHIQLEKYRLEQQYYLQIQIDNTHIEDIRESDGIFQTTKKDAEAFHGIGIKNVRSTITKLNGQIHISYTKDEFHVSILVPNYPNHATHM